MDIGKRIKDIKKKANEVKQSQAYQKVGAFVRKMGKKTIEKYNSLSRKGKMVLWGGLVATGVSIYGGVKLTDKIVEHKKKVKLEKFVRSKVDKMTQKHEIADKECFDKLFDDAFPLIVSSMLPTEGLVLEPYSDNGTVSNTIGVGSYWYPEGSNPDTTAWVLAAKYFANKDTVISGDHAVDLIKGWVKSREGGRVYDRLYKNLEGAELSVNEFAAIFGVAYNNEGNGAKLCKFVKENHDNPIACAQKIISFKPKKQFEKGIAKRHLHEAYLYLNLDDYALKVYDMKYYSGVNSKGRKYIVTSVTQLPENDIDTGKAAINSGDISKIIEEQNKICNYVKKGAVTISELLTKYMSTNYNMHLQEYNVLHLCGGTISYDGAKKLLSADDQYKQALSHYEKAREMEKNSDEKAKEEFGYALDGFQKMQKEGVHGADLSNDIEITYYHLGDYKKCIEESKKVVKTGETEAYAAAYYNMGLAYRELNNPTEAKKCFDSYKNNGGSEKAYNSAVNSLQPKPNVNAYRGR
ncbi:MAG: tetratricopeptide repeat protein [Alphaproteobacteria bacterium]|nr:tetratricopeptide repeat protein [Alphaproteobacteria bacterium]